RMGALGYGSGGAVGPGRARPGADLRAVGTSPGALASAQTAQPGAVKAKLLIQTGDADPMVPAPAVAAFEKEMTAAGASYRIIHYPGVKHSFTNPEAGTHGMAGLEDNADADKKAGGEMLKFFKADLWMPYRRGRASPRLPPDARRGATSPARRGTGRTTGRPRRSPAPSGSSTR